MRQNSQSIQLVRVETYNSEDYFPCLHCVATTLIILFGYSFEHDHPEDVEECYKSDTAKNADENTRENQKNLNLHLHEFSWVDQVYPDKRVVEETETCEQNYHISLLKYP